MSSPFEIQSPQHGDSVHHRDAYRRQETRKHVEDYKLLPKWSPKRDIIWQKNPDRVVKYRPSHLHYYGWFFFGILKNWKATVFSEVYLHIQCLLLVSWMAIIHITGLGVPNADLGTLVAMFGTPYLGAIFNYCMVVVFILGLFITLVVNRWWTIRAAYTKLMGTTTDLCMVIASSVQNPSNPTDTRISRARTELTRLLNLGHLLVIARADSQNEEFRKSYGLRMLYRKMRDSVNNRFGFGEFLSSKASVQSGTSPIFTQALAQPRNLMTFETMVNEGLMNHDEWDILQEGEVEGMPAYHMVYYWAQCLINKFKAADWILSGPQMLPLMLNKINVIVESGSTIINTINSQMPYPYVHLVSFVVHMYLFVLATWFGCFLHTGRLGELFKNPNGDGGSFVLFRKDTDDVRPSVWMIFWCYLLMTIANTTFQGMLDMHTLLDNPFGNHCAKFPIRVNVSRVTNATRTMLVFADRLPAAFGDVFQVGATEGEGMGDESAQQSRPAHNPVFTDFLNPTNTITFPVGSIGSWQGTDHDRSRASTRTSEIAQSCGKRDVCGLGRSRRNEDASMTAGGHKTRPASESHAAKVLNVHHPETSQGPQRASDSSPGGNISGDAAIQERFLQGAVHHSMEVLTSGAESRSLGNSQNLGYPNGNPRGDNV